jgi:ABC-type multidrug transport system fused ATPase/permease subunit
MAAPYKWELFLGLIALGAGSSVNLLFPELLRRYLQSTEGAALAQNLNKTVGMLAGLFLLQGISFFIRSLLFNRVGLKVVSDLREELFRSVITRSAEFFDREKVGDLVSRLNSDTALVQDLVAVRISVVVRYAVQVVCGTALMAWMSWKLTAALLLSVVIMVGASFTFIKFLRAASKNYQSSLADLSSFATECFSHAKTLIALGAEHWALQIFGERNSKGPKSVFIRGKERGIISAAFTSSASLLLNILMLFIFWYGITLVIEGVLPLSDFTAFALYGAIVAVSFSFLVSSYADVVQASGGVERIFTVISEAAEARNEKLKGKATDVIKEGKESAISVHNVTFSYVGAPERTVLHISNLSIQKGCTTALIGPSGTGKSTLVALLLGLYQPTTGTISLLGENIATLSTRQIAEIIAWAPQEPALFGLSILENLSIGNSIFSTAEITEKVGKWDFLSFIKDLPNGIQTVVGENGVQLSGGQKQRISLARAILRNPAILVLDEATSGLDSTTEGEVLKVVREELPEATVLVISHRLATTRVASDVIVLEGGAVVQHGTHESLKVAPGLYQRYIEQQTLQ